MKDKSTEISPIKNIVLDLEKRIKACEEDLTRWKENFEKNPSNAFEWSDGAFQVSAKLEKMKWLLYLLKKKGLVLKQLWNFLEESIIKDARYIKHSTSLTSSLIEEYRKSELAKLVCEYKREVEKE